jgi:hypothetical protein
MSTHDAFLRAHVAARHEQLRTFTHPYAAVERPARRRAPVWPSVRVPPRPVLRISAPRPFVSRSPRFRRA